MRTAKLSKKEIAAFQNKIYAYYNANKRSFPWRETTDAYKILVSEIMLQQTQTDRVINFYNKFLEQFPTIYSLAQAELGDVLRAWQGLGYNRRAKALHQCAKEIMRKYYGKFPENVEALTALPGIGHYTTAAIQTFAFNLPTVVIETNIRTVYIHHFLNKRKNIDDKQLIPLILQTMNKQNPRRWYNALMDYGAMLKKKHGNLSRKSKQYTKQSKFQGSDRQIRGMIIRLLTEKKRISELQIIKKLKMDSIKIKKILLYLEREELIKKEKSNYVL
ncbi:A/G-specific adenine glycosylase [Candidatus Woesearchaeota archaeon]|nr:A/G-specific adenine glycosylase [Candidatus Woesearchaeota archaeon]